MPVNPNHDEIDGQRCLHSLPASDGVFDTVTVYVRPAVLRRALDDIIGARPARVILNPGTENEAPIARLRTAGIRTQTACTLVLLRSGRY